MSDTRIAHHPVDPVFLDRWSARSFTGETMPEADLLTMFEAARWAQSANNNQPWRFTYAMRDDANWDQYVGLLMEFNEIWAKQAAALVFVLSSRFRYPEDGSERKPIGTHTLDTGAAMQCFTLQAAKLDYIAHPMAGIHVEKILETFGLSDDDYQVEAGIAVGRLGPAENLNEKLREREVKSPRKPLSETVFRGTFKG